MLVTGLTYHECHERFAALFGECAADMQAGTYDDTKRQRANAWMAAAIDLACIQRLRGKITNRVASLKNCPRYNRHMSACTYAAGLPCVCAGGT